MDARDFQRAMGWPIDAPFGHKISFQQETRIISVSDIYMFCFTLELSDNCVENMKEKFGCDACYLIKDVDRLANLITSSAQQFQVSDNDRIPAHAYRIGEVVYDLAEEKVVPYPASPLSKRQQFRWQREGRMLWYGVKPREPFVVEVPMATALLERVYL